MRPLCIEITHEAETHPLFAVSTENTGEETSSGTRLGARLSFEDADIHVG